MKAAVIIIGSLFFIWFIGEEIQHPGIVQTIFRVIALIVLIPLVIKLIREINEKINKAEKKRVAIREAEEYRIKLEEERRKKEDVINKAKDEGKFVCPDCGAIEPQRCELCGNVCVQCGVSRSYRFPNLCDKCGNEVARRKCERAEKMGIKVCWTHLIIKPGTCPHHRYLCCGCVECMDDGD